MARHQLYQFIRPGRDWLIFLGVDIGFGMIETFRTLVCREKCACPAALARERFPKILLSLPLEQVYNRI